LGTLLDIVLSMIPGWEPATVPHDIEGWFAQFQSNPLLGLRNLDLLNMGITIVSILLLVALYGALRQNAAAGATLALVVSMIGAGLFIANNAALSMLELSQKTAAAEGDAQRLAIAAAGEALLARGAHGSLGVYMGFFMSSMGSLLMSAAMLNGKVFRRWIGWAGIIGMLLLINYTTGTTFFPEVGSSLITVLAVPGGLLMMAWNIAVALRLFRLHGSA